MNELEERYLLEDLECETGLCYTLIMVGVLHTVGVNKKFSFVSRAMERPLPFHSRSNPVYFPFTCRLTSGLFRSVAIKRLFRSVKTIVPSIPLC